MYSKTRNTLTALIAATLMVAAGWLFGQPIDANSAPQGGMAQAEFAGATAQASLDTGALHRHYANRMSLAMPFYSFSLLASQRRAD